MRLKYPEYENVFKKAFGKYYTIHLRRMNGIWFEDSDLEGMPASLQRLYKRDKSGGEHFQWHQNGTLFSHKQFKNGLEDGEQKAWDMNGDLMYKYIYNEGRKYGIQGSVVCNGGKDLADNSDSID